MAAHPQPGLTPEQYLAIERAAEFRSEFYNGKMYAMAGGSFQHALIAGNVIGILHRDLKNGCHALSNDMRVRVAPRGLYTYPDVVVLCEPPKFLDGHTDTLLNPTMLVEVLSPSTERYDRGFKSAQYRELDSLLEYVLVSQSDPRVEVFRRQQDGSWNLHEAKGLESTIRFESPGCTVALRDIYDGVMFEAEVAPPPRE
jgi:Uma2 family endonuclease